MRKAFLLFFFFSLSVTAQTVYRTPSGQKYHRAGCGTVRKVSSALSVENAGRAGLAPCKVCKPPISGSAALGIRKSEKKMSGTNSLNRCTSITKKGTRCKRTTRIENGRCFQHQD